MWGASIASMNLYGYAVQNPLRFIDPSGLASHFNYLNPKYNSDNLYQFGQNYAPDEFNTVVAHGGFGGQLYPAIGPFAPIPPEQIIQDLLNDPNYDPSLPVQLDACQAAGGKDAQQIANQLHNTVYTSPDNLYPPVDANGNTIPGAPPVINVNGQSLAPQWIPIKPDSR